MTDIKIYVSANNGEEIYILPVVPENLPEIVQQWQHEPFTTANKDLTMIGKSRRRSLSLSLLLPVNKIYGFIINGAESDGNVYIEFFKKWSEKEVPMRIVITQRDAEVLNLAFTISEMSYYVDKKKDIVLDISIEEYIFAWDVGAESVESGYDWEEVNLRYRGSGFAVKAANINNRFIVPVRKVLELTGYAVTWWPDTRVITYTKDGVSKTLETEFENYGGTAFCYIYQLAAELGLVAVWDGENRTITLSDK